MSGLFRDPLSGPFRRPRAAAQPADDENELDNGAVDESGEDEDEDVDVVDVDDVVDVEHHPIEHDSSPVAHRTRSRSVSPHTIRTKQTTTTKQQTITFPISASQPTATLSNTSLPRLQPIQSIYQPSASSSSAVFPLVTKGRLRFWLPLLVSLLLTLLLLYVRPPRHYHSPAALDRDHMAYSNRQRREAVHNPTSGRSEYDQYASHQDDKEDMAKERARRLINEVHGVAAQIKQQEQDGDETPQPHYHPLKTAHPSAKDIARERREQYETDDESGWWQSTADWLGFGPYMRLQKREDGIHQVRGDDDHDTDKFDYMRGAAAGKAKASVHDSQEENEGEQTASKDDGHEHSHVNSMLTHLKELEERFGQQVGSIQQRITQMRVPPYKQTRAEDKQKQPSSEPSTNESADNDSVPVQFISTSPDHPLLDPLHSILASVESLIARPVHPANPPAAASYWSRFMAAVFPSAVSDTARDMYDIARHQASKEAARVRRGMAAQYDKLRVQLRALGEEVTGGTSEPLELYEQYNPEQVDTAGTADTATVEKAKATTHHTKEK